MKRLSFSLLISVLPMAMIGSTAFGDEPPASRASKDKAQTTLIPRRQFFGNPEKARARISPDGSKLAFLAPDEGVLNVWVAPVDNMDAAKPVTKDRHRGIRTFYWAYTSEHVLYRQDKNGDEDYHIYSVDLKSGDIRDLTPIEKIRAEFQELSHLRPEEILIGINDREERRFHDVYRVNLLSGERTLVQKNPGFAGFMTDDAFDVRFAVTFTAEGGQLYLKPTHPQASTRGWDKMMEIDPADSLTTRPVGFNKSRDTLFFLDSTNRNTAALLAMDIQTGETKVLAADKRADITDTVIHPTEKNIQAVAYTYTRREWKVLDDAIADDLARLQEIHHGDIEITSRTLDDRLWTVAYIVDDGPVHFYLYDRQAGKARFLFTSHPSLEDLPLVKMHSEIITSRDGLKLVSYLSLPAGSDPDEDGRPDQPLPMVLLVHGGPWSRDSWGYDPQHQLLANRGYAVLSVNYRGSTGFGKQFINEANLQWAGKMHNDLVDGVQWAIEKKIAQPDKVAIMGGSYGGYATLVGLTFTPELFACGVDMVGPSSLLTLLQNPPPYWAPFMPVMKARVGDWTSEEGREFLKSRSPLFYVERIKRPLLIAQGAHDPRVKQQEADQIVAAMEEKGIPVTYLLYPNEGHGLARPENRFSYYAVVEGFLAEHLGGRYESIGDAFEGAVFTVPSGANEVPGLAEALKKHNE